MAENNQVLDPSSPTKPDTPSLDDFFAAYGQQKREDVAKLATLPHRNDTPRETPLTRPHPDRQPMPLRGDGKSSQRAKQIDWADWFCRLAMVGGAMALVYVLLCGFSWSPLRDQPVANPVQRLVAPQPKTMDIQDVRVGMRTMGKNPLRKQVDPNAPEPNPETWRHLVIRMTKESGNRLDINLLRELLWIEAVGAVERESFFLDLPEMGAVGDAFVISIGPCPEIKPGPGNVVTGTFHHEADPDTKILSVTFANGAYIKGVTDNHPFFSVDANDFVPVGEMREGDYVKINGGITRLTKLESRFAYPGEMLYNLETHNEHVYQVTTAGILVHNSCTFTTSQLQSKFKHAADFGVSGTPNKANLKAFENAITNHIQNPAVQQIQGTYRGTINVTHYFDKATGNNVMVNAATNEFISGWKLSPDRPSVSNPRSPARVSNDPPGASIPRSFWFCCYSWNRFVGGSYSCVVSNVWFAGSRRRSA